MQPSSFSITPSVRKEIVKIIDARIAEAHVTKEDFSELKSIVKELAEAQKRTEVKVEELAEAQKRTEVKVEELAEAQKRTEVKVEELAEAQKRTEVKVESLVTAVEDLAASQKEMQVAITKLAVAQKETQAEVGGLSRSFSYAFENETYRFLPVVLQEKYGLKVEKKIVRAEIGGKEVNLFCRAERNGGQVLIVGETKLRLDESRFLKKKNVFAELDEKVDAVRSEYGNAEIVKVLVTHFATKAFINKAEEKGVIVVQSHEW